MSASENESLLGEKAYYVTTPIYWPVAIEAKAAGGAEAASRLKLDISDRWPTLHSLTKKENSRQLFHEHQVNVLKKSLLRYQTDDGLQRKALSIKLHRC